VRLDDLDEHRPRHHALHPACVAEELHHRPAQRLVDEAYDLLAPAVGLRVVDDAERAPPRARAWAAGFLPPRVGAIRRIMTR
jgi:hypothetical protein